MTGPRSQATALVALSVAVIVGLVVGRLAHDGAAPRDVQDRLSALQGQNQRLQGELRQLRTGAPPVVPADPVSELAPGVLHHRLTGVAVVVLSTPSGASAAAGVTRMLGLADATVTGTVGLTDAFTDPARADDLRDLAAAAVPPGVSAELPVTTDGVVAASALLAGVLLARPGVTADDRRRVLTAYASRGFLAAGASVSGPADAVILVSGATSTGTAALATLVSELHSAGPPHGAGQVVVAADGADRTVVGRVGDDPSLTTVSTVDNVGTPLGQLVCAWALVDQLAGRPGRYGAHALPPLLPAGTAGAPSVSPTPRTTAAPSGSPSPTA